MCAPAAVVPLAIAATAVTATGKIIGGINAQAQARYQARVADQNARLSADQAHDAQIRGQDQVRQLQRRQAQIEGQQTVAAAANGLDVAFGSPARLAEDTAMIGAEDVDASRRNTFSEIAGFDRQGANYRSQAQASRMKGRAALIGSLFDAGSTVLSSASQLTKFNAANASPRLSYDMSGF